jgi:hypothetical protein
MSLKRVLAAIQRTSHLKSKQMRRQFREIYKLLREIELRELWIECALPGLSLRAVIEERACWRIPYYEKFYESKRAT